MGEIQRTRPLNVNVFPLAIIYNPLVVSPESEAYVISKPNGLLTYLLGGVNIYHYPAMSPVTDVLPQTKKIEELPVLCTDPAILKPDMEVIIL
ncbi:MAG: hypothetical protein EZS28_002397 [Streblomastix strix]|uniref:Uncharacterized protein n=1 Tax=Streblomastix strix TaxID=222440 RepID=A0A5J4X4C2_9EUKA|nr:MAG: hypothetical protein EZS28_002397 [Streblomastix strix]